MQEITAQQWLSIGTLAQRSQCSVATLRFYEEKQLIWSTRTAGNQRRYQRAMLRRIALIKVAQQVGIRLEEIKQSLDTLPKNRIATKQEWQHMAQQWQSILDTKIMNLLTLRQQFDTCIGCGCLSLKQCPLRNPNDQMADRPYRDFETGLFQEVLQKTAQDWTAIQWSQDQDSTELSSSEVIMFD